MKFAYLANLSLDKNESMPLHRQLFLALRDNILSGVIKPGTRLPSTRLLATDLNVSRNTILAAFDQLTAEGYLQSKVGAGSYISDQLPDDLLQSKPNPSDRSTVSRKLKLSSHAEALRPFEKKSDNRQGDFSPGKPELEQFPFDVWARLLAKHWRRPAKSYLVDNPVAGSAALREALSEHLAQTRAVKSTPEQVIVLSGSQQAIHLVIKAFANANDPILMEDPGFPGTRTSILAAGARAIPVPIDEQGFMLNEAINRAPQARLACLSPSHQYPLGPTMSLQRRLEILNWAKQEDKFLLEDDYDSEYRYTGRPISSLQGLDTDNRVFYVGSMSKVMFSGLRLGYLVVPEDLIDIFHALRRDIDGHSPATAEAALAEFISEGHLATHIRRMRTLYDLRQKRLLSLLHEHCSDFLTVAAQECGMHLIAFLKDTLSDIAIETRCRKEGLFLRALSRFYEAADAKNGLIIGFAGTSEKQMPQLVMKLSKILQEVQLEQQS